MLRSCEVDPIVQLRCLFGFFEFVRNISMTRIQEICSGTVLRNIGDGNCECDCSVSSEIFCGIVARGAWVLPGEASVLSFLTMPPKSAKTVIEKKQSMAKRLKQMHDSCVWISHVFVGKHAIEIAFVCFNFCLFLLACFFFIYVFIYMYMYM